MNSASLSNNLANWSGIIKKDNKSSAEASAAGAEKGFEAQAHKNCTETSPCRMRCTV
ncbi:MAG: hypothetical protein ACI8SR_003548 [Oceanicoccus sp.]|jgi:hypothetical protein